MSSVGLVDQFNAEMVRKFPRAQHAPPPEPARRGRQELARRQNAVHSPDKSVEKRRMLESAARLRMCVCHSRGLRCVCFGGDSRLRIVEETN
ncbi:hypothetical protein PR202_ga26719 [Eleusine coracana subsp. coracana]|uniref:Uncharacterized protein n=1 Tax=Eleusine coracana subsp. coracana TaxID=191504 RepID=A0AAV5DEJ7_ELECO|nr:hypothetical protein PR202_ga26719 [Eleusine coracana subsp. coracana]